MDAWEYYVTIRQLQKQDREGKIWFIANVDWGLKGQRLCNIEISTWNLSGEYPWRVGLLQLKLKEEFFPSRG